MNIRQNEVEAMPIRHAAPLTRGVCVMCGCTDAVACPGGCLWADDDHNYCDRCLRRLDIYLTTPKRFRLQLAKALLGETNPNIVALAAARATGDWRRSLLYGWLAAWKRRMEKPGDGRFV
jgi:hypothetical protein